MKIYRYQHLFEGKGISNKVKELSDVLIGNMFKGKFTDFTLKTYLVRMETITILIVHKKRNYDSKFYSKSNSLSDIELTFDIPENPNPYYLHEIVTHELTHLWEFYNIKITNDELPMYSKIKKALRLTLNQDNYNILSEFRYLIYLTLDNELNARVSQAYTYLKQLKINNRNILEKEIKKSSSWKKMETIESFNPSEYYNRLIDIIGVDLSIILINDLNKELINNGFNKKFIKDINTNIDLISYFKSWTMLFKYKIRKHKQKLLKVIEEI